MKRKSGNIIGLTVMVDPDLTTDPAQRAGEIGKTVSFFPEKEIVTVRFKNRHQAVYPSNALLTLQSKKSILRALASGLIANGNDCKTMLKIYRLAFIEKRLTKAMPLAMGNNTVRFYCIISIKDWIVLQNERKAKRICLSKRNRVQ